MGAIWDVTGVGGDIEGRGTGTEDVENGGCAVMFKASMGMALMVGI